ncbi:MAG: signal transduction histidine kinase [Mariniblastus sp.]
MPSKFSILIIEDDDDARSNMEDILSLDGYEIVTASHCLPAIRAIESRHFDAVIVDWRLPDGSGRELIPIIKQEIPNSPIVVVTGMREFDTAVSALRSGAYDFLTKPINPDAFRMLISRIVERKSHLVEIESSQKRLVANERLAAIGQMVAGLAHESRNAFQRSHACLAELTLDLESMPESLSLVHKVQKALDDLNFLLEEVREYSAPIILERRQINLGELVTETWQQILDAKQAVAPEFSISVASNVPPSCYVDRERLGQVFRNLLENARFACQSPGKIQVEIEAVESPVPAQPTLSVSVLDDGKGVPDDYRDEIFHPFFTTKTKGTGLGLAICRRIVEAHQGQLVVVEHAGVGAKFVVSLPLKQRRPKHA